VIVAIAYSLTAELTLMATVRGDLVAERAASAKAAKSTDTHRDRIEAELARLADVRPAATVRAEIASHLSDPRVGDCSVMDGPRSKAACPRVAGRGPACMANPYSADLRTRVAAAVADGESSRSIAERFSIAPSTVVKWSRRVRETGSPAPAKFGGHRTCSLAPDRAFVLERIDEIPHLTLHRLKDLLAQRGVVVSHDTVRRFLRLQIP
jgi:transposase